MGFNLFFRHVILGLAASTGVLLFCIKAEAAERVVLKYSILRESVSVPELTALAQTGEVSSDLQAYLNMAGKSPDELRQALRQQVKVNPILLYQVLKSPVGEALLDRVAYVIHTPDEQANRQSLRSALVSSALKDSNITLIEVLENYPTPEVEVEGDRIASVYRQLKKLEERLPKI